MGPRDCPSNGRAGKGSTSKTKSAYVQVHHNTVFNLDKLGFGLDGWTEGVHDVEYYSNIAHHVHYGLIISSEQGGAVVNVKVYNNLAYHNSGAGFAIPWWGGTLDGMKTDIQFINNTSYANDTGFSITSPQNAEVVFGRTSSARTMPTLRSFPERFRKRRSTTTCSMGMGVMGNGCCDR